MFVHKYPRIEIIGNIASGKTTLAKHLEEHGFSTIYENFESHPFLAQFYKDPIKCAFETEIVFLLQHYNSIKSTQPNGTAVCDFSLLQDLAYACNNLDERRYAIFANIFGSLIDEIGEPTLYLNLDCNPDILLKRIKSRGRVSELGISRQYLLDLDEKLGLMRNRISNKNNILDISTENAESMVEALSPLLKSFDLK